MPDKYELRHRSAATAHENGGRMADVAGLVFIADVLWGLFDFGFGHGRNIAPVLAIGSLSAIIFCLGVSQMSRSNDL